jgi:hypothetical protein
MNTKTNLEERFPLIIWGNTIVKFFNKSGMPTEDVSFKLLVLGRNKESTFFEVFLISDSDDSSRELVEYLRGQAISSMYVHTTLKVVFTVSNWTAVYEEEKHAFGLDPIASKEKVTWVVRRVWPQVDHIVDKLGYANRRICLEITRNNFVVRDADIKIGDFMS